MEEPESGYEGWSVLELMGHRKLGGFVRAVELAGAPFFRIDVPEGGHYGAATQFYAPGAVYAITPTTEETARALARGFRPEPVQRWELPPAIEGGVPQRWEPPPAIEGGVPQRWEPPPAIEGGVTPDPEGDDGEDF